MVAIHNITRERGFRRNSFFYHIRDGKFYHIHERRGPNKIYFKCVRAYQGCGGRAVYNTIEGFHHTKDHDHQSDMEDEFAEERTLIRRILRRCKSLEYVPFSQIIAQEGRRFTYAVRSRVPLPRIRTAMRNARLSQYPNIPETLSELSDILQDDQYSVITMTTDGEDNMYGGSVTADDGSHHVLFISRRMLRFMCTVRLVHGDGTFKAVPTVPHTNQVFVIVTTWRYCVIPLAYVLMERRTQLGYEAVFQLLRVRLMEEGGFQISYIICDNEEAQYNAWNAVFDVRVQSCLTHFARALVRKIARMRLTVWMQNVPVFHQWVRLCCGLPLLPAHLLLRGLRLIIREAMGEGPFLYGLVKPFLKYVFDEWLSTGRDRRRLTVHNSKHRTNNASEVHNRMLYRKLPTPHPNVFNLIGGFVLMEEKACIDILTLRDGRRPTRARRMSSILNDRRIQGLAEDLANPVGNVDEAVSAFLHAASHHLDDLINDDLGVNETDDEMSDTEEEGSNSEQETSATEHEASVAEQNSDTEEETSDTEQETSGTEVETSDN